MLRNATAPQSRGHAVLTLIWTVLILGAAVFYLTHRDRFSADRIAESLRVFGPALLVGYVAISVARAFFLIPSTPFVLAGGLLFPDRPFLVITISLAGIALSATLIYYFSDWMGFRRHLDRLSKPMLNRTENLLTGPFGFLCLVGWAFFPLVPTDAACYVAGMVRMNFGRFLAAICLGELVICTIYVLAGHGIRQWLLPTA